MPLESSCIFCRILSGEVEASLIYKDELVTSFMDIHPLVRGHMLVIPNEHCVSLRDLNDAFSCHMFIIARQLMQAVRQSGIRSEGVNLFLADGTAAGQTIFHCHLHVIPRFQGDGFKIHFPASYGTRPSRNELNDIAEQIKNALQLNS